MSIRLNTQERVTLAQNLERLELMVERAADGYDFDRNDLSRLNDLTAAIGLCDSLTEPTAGVRRLSSQCAKIAPGLVLAYIAIHEHRGILRAANKQGGGGDE